MTEREGIIKYSLTHRYCDLDTHIDITCVNAWRHILFTLKLIGQNPERYQGLGFGNISQRLHPGRQPFLVTGTQTGQIENLNAKHFAVIETASPRENAINSHGPCQPSSEALTHASVYLNAPDIQAVIHVHSPEIWQHTRDLNLPYTAANIAYGTVTMAEAVDSLFQSGQIKQTPLFSMLGHEDGIVAFGKTLEEAALVLLKELAKALTLEQSR